MDRDQFREALLEVMERKKHPAWPKFAGEVAAELLHVHFEQEYETYVRDFPVMVGWAYVQCPIAEVRRELAENLYEEETGGLAAGRPHPALFLEYPRGLGMDMARFETVELLPGAAAYRTVLDELTQRSGWDVAAAVATIFIEGTPVRSRRARSERPQAAAAAPGRTPAGRALRLASRIAGSDQSSSASRGWASRGCLAMRPRAHVR